MILLAVAALFSATTAQEALAGGILAEQFRFGATTRQTPKRDSATYRNWDMSSAAGFRIRHFQMERRQRVRHGVNVP